MAGREELVCQLAFERGFITPLQLSEALSAKRSGESGGALEFLVAEGQLSQEQVEGLMSEVGDGSAHDAPSPAASPTGKNEPSRAALPVIVKPPSDGGVAEVVPTIEPPRADAPPPGHPDDMRLVAGYEVVGRIGRGAMGSVYRARKVDTGEIVALKVLPPSAATRQLIARFKRESEIANRLDHPNIVKCFEFGHDDRKDCHFCALELVEGENLRDMISRLGTIPETDVVTIARQLAKALDYAFGLGLVHRDVKPANVMISRGGVMKLLDLGLARPVEVEGPSVTMAGTFVGSPYYASPEQARGEQNIDIRADIYSVGATIYHMLTGHPPFEGASVTEVLIKHLDEQIPWPEGPNAELSRRLGLVAAKMMAKDPADRYQTPTEMSLDLDIVGQGTDPVIASKAPVPSTIALPGWPKVGKAKRARPPSRGEKPADRRRRPTSRQEAVRTDAPRHGGEGTGLSRAQWGFVAAGLGALVLAGAAVIAFAVRQKHEPPPSPASVAVTGRGPIEPVAPAASAVPEAPYQDRERLAREALDAAEKHAAGNPDDFAGIEAKYREALATGKGTAIEIKADAALVDLGKRRDAAAREAFDAAKERAAALVEKGDFDGAVAELERIPQHLASRVIRDVVAETTAVHEAAAAKIEAALAEAERLLAGGDAAGARAAARSIEKISFKRGQDAVAPRVMVILMKADEADQLAELAASDQADEKLANLLAEFDSLLAKADFASARTKMDAAAGEPGHEPVVDVLRAASRVAGEFEKRRLAMRATAEALVGKPAKLKTTKGLRRGELKEVTDDGVVLVSKITINRKVVGENRYEIAWDELDPDEADRLSGGWPPGNTDAAVAQAFAALARGQRAAAAKALAAAGEHPLASFVDGKLAASRPEEAPPGEGDEENWPPTLEEVKRCFRGKLVSYGPATLTIELVYDFETPEQGHDWTLGEWGTKPGDVVNVHDGQLIVKGARVWALARGVYRSVAAQVDFAAGGEGAGDAALAVFADGRGNSYNLFGLQGGKLAFVEKWIDTKFDWLTEKAPSPFVAAKRGTVALACGNGRVRGQVGDRMFQVKDHSLSSGQVGVYAREGAVAFDNLKVKGVLDEKWLREAVELVRIAAPPDAVEFNGHFYKLFREYGSWTAAKKRCEEMGGHLATITSQEENDFLVGLAGGPGGVAWIGLTDARKEGVWECVTGEPLAFTDWAEDEPSNSGRGEHWACLWLGGKWNDAPDRSKCFFVCEWEPGGAKVAPKVAEETGPEGLPAGGAKKMGLLGTYFNGADFEKPVIRRVDPTVDLKLSTRSPFPGHVDQDNFSVRWEGTISPPVSGRCVFHLVSDNGSRMWVGGKLVIDQWEPGVVEASSEPVALERGKRYPVKIEFFDTMASAAIRLTWSGPDFKDQPVPKECLAPPKGYEQSPGPPILHLLLAKRLAAEAKPLPRVRKATGLVGSYYEGMDFEKPVTRRVDPEIDFKWGAAAPAPGVPEDSFSVRWEGYVTPPRTGDYLFTTDGDDGTRLAVAGVIIIDGWYPVVGRYTATEPVRLERGKMYPIEVGYFDITGQALVRLLWSGPGIDEQVVPAECLVPAEVKAGPVPLAPSERAAGDWKTLEWGNPAKVSLSGPKGREVLTVEVPAGGGEDKAAIGTSKPPALAGKRALLLSARNLGKARVDVAVAFMTPRGYFETMPVALAPGKTGRVAVDLAARNFKCEKSNWLYESPLEGASETSQVVLVVYSGGQEAKVVFADVRAE